MTAFRRADHDRARDLGARRLDEPLGPEDAMWLEDHLAACAACAAVAEAYEADHRLFAPLREAAPLPPRDLWARTAAAIDAEAGAAGGRPATRARRLFGLPIASLAPIAAVGVVGIVVGSTLLTGAPAVPGPGGPSVPEATAIATSGGQVAVVTRGEDGSLQVRTVDLGEVCPLMNDGCAAAEPSVELSTIARVDDGTDSVGAIISPRKDRIVVVQRDASGADGVYVVPVKPARGGTGTAAETPGPTEATPAATAPAATAAPSDVPSEMPTTDPSEAPDETGAAPTDPPATDPPATEVPPSDAPPSGDPGSPPPSEAPPSATPAPETPGPTAETTPVPSVEVTPAPDGAIEIARDVVVVGAVAAYDRAGNRFAFTARPARGSTGPNVYVWNTDDTRARAITTDHRSLFAGWDGGDVLVSRVVDGVGRTFALNARTGAEKAEQGRGAWLPTVAPDGSRAVWWDGSVRLAADGVTWVPDRGRLVLGGWPGDPGDVQVLSRGGMTDWEVQWTPDGTAVAVWTAGSGDAPGRLSLYAVDADGRARVASPLLDAEAAYAGFSLEDGQLAYAAPARGGRTVWALLFDEDGPVGTRELPGEAGATLVR